MIQKERTRPDAATSERSEMGNGLATSISQNNFTSNPSMGQFKVYDFLSIGQENAVSLRHLKKIMGLDGREIRRMIQSERKKGTPILADNVTGYFLPGSEDERRRCVRSMRHRAHEILLAAQAIEDAEIHQAFKPIQGEKRASDPALGQMRLDGV